MFLRSRQALILFVALALAASAAGVAISAGASAQPSPQPLLPLARGQMLASLGRPPQWLPLRGRPLTVTLFSGRPRSRATARANAYFALGPVTRACGRSAARDHTRPLHEILAFYSPAHRVLSGSPFTPSGGAAPGVYGASVHGIVVRQRGAVRVCAWLGSTPRNSRLALRQDVPLLNGLFAASVAALPSAAPRGTGAYTVQAFSASQAFRLSAATTACGQTLRDGPSRVPAGTPGSDSISFGANSCAGDGTTFTFAASGGRPLGTLAFAVAQARAAPPQVAAVGGCELDPVTVTTVRVATAYVGAVGCTVGRLLVQPFQRGVPRGAVVEAQVDGSAAEVAPRGTAVDLVLNGRPR